MLSTMVLRSLEILLVTAATAGALGRRWTIRPGGDDNDDDAR